MGSKNSKLVAYDLSKNRNRSKAARRLLRTGIRLQESVYLLELDSAGLPRLVDDLRRLRETGDVIDIIPVCQNCMGRALRLAEPVPLAHVVFGPDRQTLAASTPSDPKPEPPLDNG